MSGRMRFWVLVVGVILVANTASAHPANLAQATAGYLYFNRSGATIEEHDRDLRNCSEVAANNYLGTARARLAENGAPAPPGYILGPVGQWIIDSLEDARLSGWERAHRNVVVENCMIVRGWRLVRLSDEHGRELAALGHDELRDQMLPLVGAQTPTGEVTRVWRNEAADPTSVYAVSPRNARRTLLSLLSAAPDTTLPPDPFASASRSELTEVMIEPIEAAQTLTLSPNQAIIVVGLTGVRSRARHFWMALEHQQRSTKYRIALNIAGAENLGDGRYSNTLVFAVPAGEWRVQGFGPNLDFCMGAPSFTVDASEVVFAGEFNTDEILQPDVSDAAMQRHGPSSLAPSIRPASWTNGATWACPPINAYALEFPGAPFKADYHWASARAP